MVSPLYQFTSQGGLSKGSRMTTEGDWEYYHHRASTLAALAEQRILDGEDPRPDYWQAARMEECALSACERSKKRTLGITVVSAVSLFRKAGKKDRAIELARAWIAKKILPEFAIDKLSDFLED